VTSPNQGTKCTFYLRFALLCVVRVPRSRLSCFFRRCCAAFHLLVHVHVYVPLPWCR
jgi:hypothetical protein